MKKFLVLTFAILITSISLVGSSLMKSADVQPPISSPTTVADVQPPISGASTTTA